MEKTPDSIVVRRRDYRRRWWFANAGGFAAAHLIYSLVGHGVTGPHGDQLTRAQYLAHTIGLVAVALIVLRLQRAALAPHVRVSGTRILTGTVLFVAAFWLGAETVGPPADWVFGFTVLGTAAWIGLPSMKESRTVWSVLAVVAFWGGIAAAAGVIGLSIWLGIYDPSEETLLNHTIFWVLLGGVTGAAGSYLNGWPLSRLLIAINR